MADIKEPIANDNSKLYSLSLSDRFSELTLFSLSCKVLAHNIEKAMFNFIISNHQIRKIEFKNTGKKRGIKSFFTKALFTFVVTSYEAAKFL